MSKRGMRYHRLMQRLPHKERHSGDSGYIYVVRLGIEDLHKIGRTKNITARVLDLQSSNPLATPILAQIVPDMAQAEHKLDKMFGKNRKQREIYHLLQDDIKKISDYLDSESAKYKPLQFPAPTTEMQQESGPTIPENQDG